MGVFDDLDKQHGIQVDKPAPPEQSWVQYGLQTADDAVRAAANTLTFGMADRLAGAAGQATGVKQIDISPSGAPSVGITAAPDYSTAVNEQVKQSEQARERSPYASVGGDVGGAVLLPGIGGRQLAARYGGGLAARAAGYGAEGAAYGAATGAGNTYTERPSDYAANAGIGSILGLGTGAAFGGAFGPRAPVSSAAKPTFQETREAADTGYRELRANQARYYPDPVYNTAADLKNILLSEGFHQGNAKETFAVLDKMQKDVAFQAPPVLEALRQQLNKIPKSADASSDRAASKYVKDAIHDFMINPPKGAVVPGTEAAAAEAGKIAAEARGNYAASKRAQLTSGIIENVENKTASAHSGLNKENTIRQQITSLINPLSQASRSKLAGFNEEERGALRSLVHRGDVADKMRYVGNVLGGGGGVALPIVGAIAGGSAGSYFKDSPTVGAAMGAAAPTAGLALRLASNRSAGNAIKAADELIRSRSPLYAQRAASAPMVSVPTNPKTLAGRNAVTIELMRQSGMIPDEEQQ